MNEASALDPVDEHDSAPGDARLNGGGIARGVLGYLAGLALAAGLTLTSFHVAGAGVLWHGAVPAALVALAVGQIGVHLVFFLHLTSGPESINNILALAFGLLIVFLLLAGTLFVMAHLDHNMLPLDQILRMQR